jgi:uncharacterized membrane protein YcaP (DUF421 family)
MKKEDIHLSDIMRILIGEAPPVFLLEVFIRTLIVYLFLLYTLRWLGKRMSGQLTIMELSVMLTLGAIVSASMQLPDHGIMESFLLLCCAFGFQRGISYLGVKSSPIEDFTQGKAGILVKDGVLLLKEMADYRVTRQQVFAQLRSQQIYNLGLVDRMYLEASGMYSVYKRDAPKPGLSVLPPDDPAIQAMQTDAAEVLACQSCGIVRTLNDREICRACGHDKWLRAVN